MSRLLSPIARATLVVALPCAASLATAALASGPARTQGVAGPAQPPVFGAAVELVRLDVLVLDHGGRPVTGLTAADFEVSENGRAQAITSFEPVVVRGARPVPEEPPRLTAARLRPPSEGRCLFFYVDDVHVAQPAIERVRQSLRRFMETEAREGDWVTLYAPEQELWWTARNGWEYRQLAQVIERLKGQGSGDSYEDWEKVRALEYGLPGVSGRRGVMAGGTPGASRPSGIPGGNEGPADEAVAGVGKGEAELGQELVSSLVKRRTGMTLGGLRQALESMVTLRGHKSLILVSEGFLLLPQMPGYHELVDFARRANVAIHLLDPRGLETGLGDASLRSGESPPALTSAGTALALVMGDADGGASVTGGHVFTSTDTAKALRQVAAESDSYYLLGFTPDTPARGERKLNVRVRREGLKVLARTRYFVPEDAKPAQAAKEPKSGRKPAAPAASPAGNAMRSLSDTTELAVRVSTLFFEPNRKGEIATMLAVEVVPPPGKAGERLYKLVSEARTRDGGAPVRDEFEGSPKVTPGAAVILARQWNLTPGVWQLRLVVEDTQAGKLGSLVHTFEVPDAKSFRISTPILTAELDDPEGRRKPRVSLARTFRSGTILYCQYSAYGAPAAGRHDWVPHVFGSWRLRRGDDVVREAGPTLIQPAADGRVTRTLGINLQGAPPGEYALELAARDEQSGASVTRTEAFTVAP